MHQDILAVRFLDVNLPVCVLPSQKDKCRVRRRECRISSLPPSTSSGSKLRSLTIGTSCPSILPCPPRAGGTKYSSTPSLTKPLPSASGPVSSQFQGPPAHPTLSLSSSLHIHCAFKRLLSYCRNYLYDFSFSRKLLEGWMMSYFP